LEFKARGGAELMLVELPRTVDGPVPERAQAGEAERTRSEWVLEEIPDESFGEGWTISGA
jgi:hypothetical protein